MASQTCEGEQGEPDRRVRYDEVRARYSVLSASIPSPEVPWQSTEPGCCCLCCGVSDGGAKGRERSVGDFHMERVVASEFTGAGAPEFNGVGDTPEVQQLLYLRLF